MTLITGPALGPEGSLMDRAHGYGYRVIEMDEMRRAIGLRDWRAYRRLKGLLRELRPDIVHTHSSKAGILGRYAARRAGAGAIIHTIHGLSFTASTSRLVNWLYRMLERRAARLSTRIVCVADAMRDESLAADIGRPEQYVTVYSGMSIEPFLNPPVARAAVRAELGLSPDNIAVGTIARLFHMKGHEDLLDAAPDLCARFPRLRFLWIGDGILRGEFERRIAAMNLRGRFILTGLVPPERIPQLTGAMDILVHPSRREGLARALVQGQLAGKPVLAYDIDGNREGLINGQTGYLVPPFDAGKLSRRLAVLLEDESLRRRMGEAGRAFASSRFAAGVMVDGLETVYREAITQQGKTT